jgi:hypothetical protein
MRTLVFGVLAATVAGCSCFVSPQSGIEACTGGDGRGFACFDRNVAASRLSQATEPEPSTFDPDTPTSRERTALAGRTAKPSSAHAADKTRHAGKPAKPIAIAAAKAEPTAAAPPPDTIDPAVDRAKIGVPVNQEKPAKPIATTAAKAEPTAVAPPPDTIDPVVDKIAVPVKLEKPAKPIATTAAKAEPTAAAPPPAKIDPVVDKAKIAVAVKLENPASAAFSDMNRSMRQNMRGQFVDTICGHVKGKKASGEDIGDRPFLYLVKDDEAYVADDSPTSVASTAYRNICN